MNFKLNGVFLYALLFLIILLGAYFRIVPAFDMVFAENDKTFLLGVDPFFYLRHVETTILNFPQLQVFDHATHYPNGVNSDSTGLLTLILAFICKIILGNDATSDQIAMLLSWIPPILSCFIFYIVFKTSALIRDKFTGLLSTYILLIYPGLFLPRSLLGFVDHHVVEILLATSMVYGISSCLTDIHNGIIKYHKLIFSVIPFVLFFTMWAGAPLYFILSGLVFVNCIILFRGPRLHLKKLSQFALYYFLLCGFLYSIIYFLQPDWLTNAFPKYQSILKFLLPLGGVVLYILGEIKLRYYELLRKPFSIIFLLFLNITVIWLFLDNTKIGQEIISRLTFRVTDLTENRKVNLFNLLDMVSIPGILALIAGAYYFISFIWDSSKRVQIIPTLIFTSFMVFMWLNTYDMGYMVAPFISILTGILIRDLIFFKKSSLLPKKISYVFKGLTYVLVLFMIIKPLVFNSPLYPFVFTPQKVNSLLIYSEAWHEGMDWLKKNSPALKYPVNEIFEKEDITQDEGQYGVVTAWDYGNIVNQKGQRIPTWSRWSHVQATRGLYSPIDSLETKELCYNCDSNHTIKYIAVNSKMAGPFFLSKFNQLYKDLNLCYTYKTLNFNDSTFEAPSFGECYESSLVFSLYRGENLENKPYKLVWESDQKMVSGYFYDGYTLRMIDMKPDVFGNEEIEKIDSTGMAPMTEGLLYNAYMGSELKIYEIVN